jgi:hypothetical protein
MLLRHRLQCVYHAPLVHLPTKQAAFHVIRVHLVHLNLLQEKMRVSRVLPVHSHQLLDKNRVHHVLLVLLSMLQARQVV